MSSRIALIALVVTTGCDPVGSVGAVIVDDTGAPVVGAHVRFACPRTGGASGFGDGDDVVTDATGKFTDQRIPNIDATCTMTVDKPGFISKVLVRKDVAYQKGVFDPTKALPRVTLDRVK